MSLCSLPQGTGCQGKAKLFLSLSCVQGRTSQCGYICMTKLYTKILS